MIMPTRHGSTLLELIIATALFSTLVVLVLEAMMNMRGLASTVEDLDILEEQAGKAQHAISKDLANSGWFYCLPGASGRKFYPQVHLSDRQAWQLADIAPTPSVTIPIFKPGTPPTMVPTTFNASVSLNRATVLGDALVFTRLHPEGQMLSDQPSRASSAIVNFNRENPQRLEKFANARAIQGLVINPSANDQPDLASVVWETTPAAVADGLKAADMYNDQKVRLFCYRVVPDPVSGRGQLIRYYSNPDSGDRNTDGAWAVDEVIANDVVGMRIYSFEMASWYAGTDEKRDFTTNDAAGLTNNQIRFFIDFARNLEQIDGKTAIDVDQRGSTARASDNRRASTVKTLQFTIGLRSITNALDQ